jgi:hypothetical protein
MRGDRRRFLQGTADVAAARPLDAGRRRWLAGLVAIAVAPAAAATAPRPAFDRGRLFRVTRPGRPDSFVFGTIHLADPRVSEVPPAVSAALARSRTLALEIAPVQVVETELDELEVLENGRRLEPLIGAHAYEELRYRLLPTGTPERVVARLKPWAAWLRLSLRSPLSDERSLEENLLAQARQRRMSWMSLESVEEQVAAFDTIPLDAQVALLKHALLHRDSQAAAAEQAIAAWLPGDLAAVAGVPDDMARRFPELKPHYAALVRHLVVDRTALLHHRLFMPLRSGSVLAAVGASHLPGRDGLLAMLVADGYRVDRIG